MMISGVSWSVSPDLRVLYRPPGRLVLRSWRRPGRSGTRLRWKVISKARSAARSPRRSGGKASGVADAAADGVAGAGEGDPGGIQARVACGVGDQGADRLVAAEPGGGALAAHRRGLARPERPRAA